MKVVYVHVYEVSSSTYEGIDMNTYMLDICIFNQNGWQDRHFIPVKTQQNHKHFTN